MRKAFEMSAIFATDPLDVYDAWISAERHAAMTGAGAASSPRVGGAFTAWDGYISGRHLELEPASRVVQAWRTTEFPAGAPDSRLEVLFAEAPQGTRLTLVHSDLPDGQSQRYAAGWQDFYFEPMQRYFAASDEPRAPEPRSAPGKRRAAPVEGGRPKAAPAAAKKSKAAPAAAKKSKAAPAAAKKSKAAPAAAKKSRRSG